MSDQQTRKNDRPNNKMCTVAGTVFEYAASIAASASTISLTTDTMVETFPGCGLIRDCSEMTCQFRC